jgi:hypothetical protein
LKNVTAVAFDLSSGFRDNTNPMYFDLLGSRREFAAIAAGGWLGNQRHREFIRQFEQALYDLIAE